MIQILTGAQMVDESTLIGQYLREMIPHGIIELPRMHNEILNKLLHLSTKSVSIISPWISGNVVTEDMLNEIRVKVQGGIPIHIIFGHRAQNCSLADIEQLVEKDVPWRKGDSAKAIRALLELLGDGLKYDPPSHVKLLLVDDQYLFIGSLNWLYNSGKTDQKEISCLITNPDTIQYVKEKYLE